MLRKRATATESKAATPIFRRTRIMETNPDALFISALSTEIAGILTQRRAIGMPDSVRFIVPDLTGDEVETAGEGAEGAIAFIGWTLTADTPGNQAFVLRRY